MRNSFISKKLSDSVLGLALVVTPMSFLVRPHAGVEATPEPLAMMPSISQTSSMGRFLETEVSSRIERVSGRKYEPNVRVQRSREIASAVAEASYIYDVDPFLLLSMIEVESRYQADAVGRHGEIGLMQIKPSTARWVAPVTDALYDCDLHEVRCNIMMGTSYVSHLQDRAEKQRNGSDEAIAQTLATAAKFREHVLRSYNLGPAKANRLANDRAPSAEGEAAPYALKIVERSDHMRRRYLAEAVRENSKVANSAAKSPTLDKKMKRAPESISTVATIR